MNKRDSLWSTYALLTLLIVWAILTVIPLFHAMTLHALEPVSDFWKELAEVYSSASQEVKAALIGGTIVVTGVILTNRAQYNSLKAQMDHDTKERLAERVGTLRRDVYLQAAENSVKAMAFIMSIPDLNKTYGNYSKGLAEFHAVTAKLKLIVDITTVQIIDELNFQYLRLFKLAVIVSNELNDLRSEVESTNKELEMLNDAIRHCSDRWKTLESTAFADIAAAEQLNARIEEYNNHQSGLLSTINDLEEDLVNKHQASLRQLMNESKGIMAIQVQLLDALRKDFDLDSDIELFVKQSRANLLRMQELVG